jgi:hypothetical protein
MAHLGIDENRNELDVHCPREDPKTGFQHRIRMTPTFYFHLIKLLLVP